MSDEGLAGQLRYMTVQIQTSKTHNTNWTGSGTGFLYNFIKADTQWPMLVTNKHVIEGAITIGLTFHISTDHNQTPLSGPGRLVSVLAKDIPIVRHPDSNVDLAGILIWPLIDQALNRDQWQPYIKCLGSSHLPSAEMISDFGAIEDVLMVGYPTGVVDVANNFPIIRRGITSTPYTSDYRGKKEFLADIPVYPGSSGSPIIIVTEGVAFKGNSLVFGQRTLALIGVLYAGHTETVNGQIVAEPIPTNLKPVAKVTHMINLGICIKSSLIEDLAAQIPGWNAV